MTEAVDTRQAERRIPADKFGYRLMVARADSGNLTIDQASQRCGILAQNWSNWERGRLPRDIRDVVTAVSEGLGIDREWLEYGGTLTPEPRRRRISLTYTRDPRTPVAKRLTPSRPRGRGPGLNVRPEGARPRILRRPVAA